MDQAFTYALQAQSNFEEIKMEATMLIASLTLIVIFGILLFAKKDCWNKKTGQPRANIIKKLSKTKPSGSLKVPSIKPKAL